MEISCPGVVVTDTAGAPLCQDEFGAVVAWVDVSSWVPEITNAQAMELFGAALLLWSLAFAGKILRRTIEKGK